MSAKIQLLGPVALVLVVASAEAAAAALTSTPSSAILWQLNLGVFGFLQPSAYLLFRLLHVPYADVLLVLLLGMMAFVGASRESRFLLAFCNHVGLGCGCVIFACWLQSRTVSIPEMLRLLSDSTDWRVVVALGLVLVSIASAVASQMQYLCDFRRAENAAAGPLWNIWPQPLPV